MIDTPPYEKLLSTLSANKEGGYAFEILKDSWSNESAIDELGL
jgi:hypothetical protein